MDLCVISCNVFQRIPINDIITLGRSPKIKYPEIVRVHRPCSARTGARDACVIGFDSGVNNKHMKGE